MTFIVTLPHLGATFYLKGTIWTSALARAQVYQTSAEAQVALDKAKRFMKAAQRNLAKIEVN